MPRSAGGCGDAADDWRSLALARRPSHPAVEMTRPQAARNLRAHGYVCTYLERDLQDLRQRSARFPTFRRLMRAALAARASAQLVNQTELGRDDRAALTLQRCPPAEPDVLSAPCGCRQTFAVNAQGRRLILQDLLGRHGAAAHWGEVDEPGEAGISRTSSLNDLLAWRDARLERAEIGYWRTASADSANEVKFVIASSGAKRTTAASTDFAKLPPPDPAPSMGRGLVPVCFCTPAAHSNGWRPTCRRQAPWWRVSIRRRSLAVLSPLTRSALGLVILTGPAGMLRSRGPRRSTAPAYRGRGVVLR